MAWHKLQMGEVQSVAVNSVTGAETVRPVLYATRTVSIASTAVDTPDERRVAGAYADPVWSAYGLLFNGFSMLLAAPEEATAGGSLPLGFDTLELYNVTYLKEGRTFQAGEAAHTYGSNGSKTWLDDYLIASDAATQTSTSIDILQGMDPIEIDIDRTTRFDAQLFGADYFAVSSTTTGFDGLVIGAAGTGYGNELTASYKSAPRPPKFPRLIPVWTGADKVEVIFPIDVGTVESTGTVYVRWARGQVTGTTVYDGQTQVVVGSRGLDPEYLTATLTGLEADTDYSCWVYLERDSTINTETSGPVTYFRTEASSDYTYGIAAGTVTQSVQVSPTGARFSFNLTVSRLQRLTEILLPAVRIEIIEQADHAAHGWADPYVIRSVPIGPFYPQQTWTYDATAGAYISAGIANFREPQEVTGSLSGTIEVNHLVQGTAYYWRLRVDQPGGTDYPIPQQVLVTPLFDPSRPDISPQFTMGGF